MALRAKAAIVGGNWLNWRKGAARGAPANLEPAPGGGALPGCSGQAVQDILTRPPCGHSILREW